MSLVTHLAVLGLLVLDLLVGGSLVDRLGGRGAVIGFELLLIAGYVLLVLRLGPPWPRDDDQG